MTPLRQRMLQDMDIRKLAANTQKAYVQQISALARHTKSDNRMDRCWLGGSSGDALHAVLCAAGFSIRWLLRAIAAKGLVALLLAFSQVALYAACIGNRLRITTLAAGRTNRRFDWRHTRIMPSLATG